MSLFNRYSDEQLAADGQKARINLECANCVSEIDDFVNNLRALQEFIKSDKKIAAQIVYKIVRTMPIVNYRLPISPFLQETRVTVSEFLLKFNEDYNPNDDGTVGQALFNAAADGQISSLIQHIQQQINIINRMRR